MPIITFIKKNHQCKKKSVLYFKNADKIRLKIVNTDIQISVAQYLQNQYA